MNNHQKKESQKYSDAVEDTVSELVVSLGVSTGVGGLPLVIYRTIQERVKDMSSIQNHIKCKMLTTDIK
jgi:hypothetical protein